MGDALAHLDGFRAANGPSHSLEEDGHIRVRDLGKLFHRRCRCSIHHVCRLHARALGLPLNQICVRELELVTDMCSNQPLTIGRLLTGYQPRK